ncbi:ribosome assembly protein 1 [Phalaenopsis equestris]|uniref:ribosome assembly protein 1 n=1 Tax=Phalaenopsis equestris TaxID=78828 RepID=UPI0009E261B0|nr:ribosome assembly protein 1 [Phalaenopsis equestris]
MADYSTRNIRNICILAHVDHGKTTLADHLIAAYGGGVLNPKLAGNVRFMDYLDEEQRRAITMKSSSISLHFRDHSINLIDSPGHMDFCSEVSTAARLSDGALILVDAVEGVHIQTHAVLRQSWVEKLTPCLVLNKIDRLITELKLTPMEAYTRLLRIVHEVNGIVSAYKSEKYLSDVDSLLAGASENGDGEYDHELVEDDEEDTFQPQKGNVAFACALDGWGFYIEQFAEFYASKLGASMAALKKGFWGPRYFNTKKMMIVGKKGMEGFSRDPQPMFVQFVLKPLWQVYQAALDANGDKDMFQKVIKTFNLSVPQRELQNKDTKAVLQAVMRRWLPLSDAVLSMVIKCIPDPISAQSLRISRLLPKREVKVDGNEHYSEVVAEAEHVRKCVEVCDSSPEAPCVVFVSKMFAVPAKMIPKKGPNGEKLIHSLSGEVGGGESEEFFLAFARIFSGVLNCGQKVFVLSALYDPLKIDFSQKHLQDAEVQHLYLMMGQGLKPVSCASAGNLVAIQGLGQYILKSATLSTSRNCWPFSSMMFQVAPTLRVAIEPSDPANMGALMRGLRLLNRADPFVEVTVSSRGEQVLAAAGEVHLERCIKDLKERFAKVSLEVSPPLVSYKETIEGGEGFSFLDTLKVTSSSAQYVEKVTSNGRCMVRVQVVRIPNALTKVLEESAEILADIIEGRPVKKNGNLGYVSHDGGDPVAVLRKLLIDSLESELELDSDKSDTDKLEKNKQLCSMFLQRIWSLGPRQVGPNILLVPDSKTTEVIHASSGERGFLIHGSYDVSEKLGFLDISSSDEIIDTDNGETSEATSSINLEAEALKNSIVAGFQLATSAGPLCDEPVWGLAFLVKSYIFPDNLETKDQLDQYGILSGQVMTAVKDACRAAVLQSKPRLAEAMYFCELNTPGDFLKKMYAVLSRRRSKVLKEEMQESSPLFTVHAYVPVAESFGFADELRKSTGAAASALLVLSHWEVLPEDPFFIPKTEEEIEEYGDGSSVLPNIARKLIDAVRRRKGLHVEDKVVQHATKQRTLARKIIKQWISAHHILQMRLSYCEVYHATIGSDTTILEGLYMNHPRIFKISDITSFANTNDIFCLLLIDLKKSTL